MAISSQLPPLMGMGDSDSLAENLLQTPFDALYETDLRTGRYRSIYHIEGKYAVPMLEGSFGNLVRHAGQYLIRADGREAFARFLDPADVHERLKNSSVPGLLWTELWMRTVSGDYIHTLHMLAGGEAAGLPEHILRCYIYDISAQDRRVAVNTLSEKANRSGLVRDPLTGVFQERDFFALAQERLRSLEGEWCLVEIDTEHYKLFSDWFGVEKGRELLRRYGEILLNAALERDGLAGYRGTDLFSLLAPYDRPWLETLYVSLQSTVRGMCGMEGFDPVFGICLIGEQEREMPVLELYNRAAITAEEIVQQHSGSIQVYDAELHRKNSQEYQLLNEFQNAIENGEISFWLQPQCSVESHRIVGAESLARWKKPDGSWVSPAVFVPVLEKYGVVTRLDRFIWDAVCRWLRSWMDRGHRPVPVSVNVSRIDIVDLDIPAYFGELVRKYELPAGALKIEITESAYVEESSLVRSTVSRLREQGFMVLMDDFGSGYSSLNMLRSLNVDVIKLDAQFLRMAGEEARKAISILESIVAMTKNLSTPVIVEGVETREQEQFLTELGCGYIQGFYFYRPMPVIEFEALIRDEGRVDRQGFVFNANQQLHVREFLDENIYSDAMLNNIIGPVAFYRLHDRSIDIIRYNEQFFHLVGIPIQEFNSRICNIQDFFYPGDAERMFRMMELAERDPMNGARGVVRTYRPNGVLVWLSIHLYYMGEDEQGKTFYGSDQDVTELQNINVDLPGAYFRCTADEEFRFLFLSENFLSLTGYTEGEIQALYGGRLTAMVHPDDLEKLMEDTAAFQAGSIDSLPPYRLRRKGGGYIFVAEQCRLTDTFGTVCWQSVVMDVTEVIHARRQMRLLADYFQGAILFLHRQDGALAFEVAVYGLEEKLGVDGKTLERLLNSGELCHWVESADSLPVPASPEECAASALRGPRRLVFRLPSGESCRISVKADEVQDRSDGVEYILTLRETPGDVEE